MQLENTITLSANTSWYLYNFRASSIRRLIEDGWRVICLSPEDPYAEKLESELGCVWLPLAVDNKGSSVIRDLGLVIQLFRYYRNIRPSVALHFTVKLNIYGVWAAKISGIPVINNVSGLGYSIYSRWPCVEPGQNPVQA